MSDLLPCPFCGGEAEITDRDVGAVKSPDIFVRCRRCKKGDNYGYCRRETAVEAWNARPQPAAVDAKALLDALCECLDLSIGRDEERRALEIIAQHRHRPSPTPATVSEEMVERAYAVWAARESIYPSALSEKRSMRAALQAALGREDGWIACSERMPTDYDNWVLAWNPKWPRVRLLNWCNVRADSGHWRNEADDICYLDPTPTHWRCPLPPPPATKDQP